MIKIYSYCLVLIITVFSLDVFSCPSFDYLSNNKLYIEKKLSTCSIDISDFIEVRKKIKNMILENRIPHRNHIGINQYPLGYYIFDIRFENSLIYITVHMLTEFEDLKGVLVEFDLYVFKENKFIESKSIGVSKSLLLDE